MSEPTLEGCIVSKAGWLGQICRRMGNRVHNISKIGGEWFSQVSSYLGLGRGRGPQKEMPSVSPFALGEVS